MTSLFHKSFRFALLALFVLGASLPAWAVDLSVTHNPYTLTPVSDIQADQVKTPAVVPASPDEPTPVSDIQTIDQKPADTASNIPLSPAVYEPQNTPTFVVFPVMLHNAKDKAFSDLPILLSSAIANQLTSKVMKDGLNYTVLNPIYTYDDLKEKGLDGLYQKIVQDYQQAGAPNEKDLLYLTDHLAGPRQQIAWVVFVEAEFDTNHVTSAVGMGEKMKSLINQAPPEPNYFLKGTVQMFSTLDGVPLVWHRSGSYRMKLSSFNNFTRSIYDDSDSIVNFKFATTKLANQILSDIPEEAYVMRTNVQAALVETAAPKASAAHPMSNGKN